ncbi:MAG: T9SS type A sorting domain-containing protein [Bacteroidetes bacterium]|nr:T9SS type A sorting domain-containing protein [Bacteroidota bacterium]MBS1930561.1 T9SS type A sorting domain-containing protein [Bacteroidota bacterium]
MKKIFAKYFYKKSPLLIALCMLNIASFGQNAVISTPLGIGKNCGGSSTTDSFRVLSYNDATNTLSPIFKCKPKLGGGSPSGPAFSSSAGSIAYNPYDQNVYYIATTTGNNSFVYHWRPDTCHTSGPNQVWSNYYNNKFVVGLDFNPLVPNEGFQLEFTGTGPYNPFLRKVDFTTSYFGPSDTIVLSGGKTIYQLNGDIIFTPMGKLYFAFDNKLFFVDYSTYGGAAKKVYATYIDTLNFGATGINLTGIAYAQGKFIGSTQKGSGSPCAFKEIDISSGSAVILPVTLPANNYTATDMATMITGIGVAKKVSFVTSLGSNNWMVQYDVKVKNFGNIRLINVQVVDSVAKVFGASFTSASVSAVGTLPSGLTLNPAYNGNTNCNLFVGGSGSILNATPSDSGTVRITVLLNNPDSLKTYYNSALGSGQSQLFGNNVMDSSNNSGMMRADPNDNGIPDDSLEDIPTPFRIQDWVLVPTNLIDFNARLQSDKSVNLFWKMTDNEFFNNMKVQRSNDAVHFATIDEISSISTNGIRNYQYVDRNPASGLNYYRIMFKHQSGEIFYSEIVKINLSDPLKPILQVSPVPFSDKIRFTIQLDRNEQLNCKLIDFTGRIIYSGKRIGMQGENSFEIDQLHPYPSGSYVLQVQTGEASYNKLILKNHQ